MAVGDFIMRSKLPGRAIYFQSVGPRSKGAAWKQYVLAAFCILGSFLRRRGLSLFDHATFVSYILA